MFEPRSVLQSLKWTWTQLKWVEVCHWNAFNHSIPVIVTEYRLHSMGSNRPKISTCDSVYAEKRKKAINQRAMLEEGGGGSKLKWRSTTVRLKFGTVFTTEKNCTWYVFLEIDSETAEKEVVHRNTACEDTNNFEQPQALFQRRGNVCALLSIDKRF